MCYIKKKIPGDPQNMTVMLFTIFFLVFFSTVQGQLVSLNQDNQWHYTKSVKGIDIDNSPYEYSCSLSKTVMGDTVFNSIIYKKIKCVDSRHQNEVKWEFWATDESTFSTLIEGRLYDSSICNDTSWVDYSLYPFVSTIQVLPFVSDIFDERKKIQEWRIHEILAEKPSASKSTITRTAETFGIVYQQSSSSFEAMREHSELNLRGATIDGIHYTVYNGIPLPKDDNNGVRIVTSCYPNPFNTMTNIQVSIQKTHHVEIAVFDIHGILVRLLADEVYTPGIKTLQWDGTGSSQSECPSGVYFIRFKSDTYSTVKRVTMMR